MREVGIEYIQTRMHQGLSACLEGSNVRPVVLPDLCRIPVQSVPEAVPTIARDAFGNATVNRPLPHQFSS